MRAEKNDAAYLQDMLNAGEAVVRYVSGKSRAEYDSDEIRVISEREAWLLNNPEARRSVARGLEQARKGRFAASPNLEADQALVETRTLPRRLPMMDGQPMEWNRASVCRLRSLRPCR